MESDCKSTGKEDKVSEIKVSIKNLYKIFGSYPTKMVNYVKEGIPKRDLMNKHNHILGLRDVNIEIQASKIQVIMGLSGSGKSTLLRHINRLIEPTVGEIIIDNRNVLEMNKTELRDFRRFQASMVFQKFALLPHRTVKENVAYGLMIQEIPKQEAEECCRKWIEQVGLTGCESQYPAQLSGGMQQRVGLARSLATDAEILLMDEPFSALDPLIRTEMQDILLELQAELRKTIIFITHDLDEALRIGDNIAILRDGEVVQQGSSQDIILNPANGYVADFIKDINRGRVLQIASIMDNKNPGSGPRIEQSTTIEDALQVLLENGARTAIVTDKAESVGSIGMDKMIASMARPTVVSESVDAYN